MKRILYTILPILLAASALQAKSYHFTDITTRLYVLTDGSVDVEQERTYSFDGSFSWADLDLVKRGADGIVFGHVAEKDGDEWRVIEGAETSDSPKSLYVKWFYSAQDEERTFLIAYTITGAVKRHADVAEFYWKVIEQEHEPAASTRTEIYLPGPSPELFKVYVHSAARPGSLVFSDSFNRAVIVQAGIPKNTFVEVRLLCSPALFPAVTQSPEKRYARILSDEKGNFLRSSLKTYVALPLALILMLLVPLVLLIVFYNRFGREPKIDYQVLYEHEPPRKAPPVAVPFILHQKPEKSSMTQELFGGMMATLLDLARRRAVSVVETKEGRKTKYTFRLDRADVALREDSFDRAVVEFFFGKVAGGSSELTEEMVKKYGQNHSSEVLEVLSGLFSSGNRWWERELGVAFVEQASTNAYTLFGTIAAASIALGGFLLAQGLGAIAPSLGAGRVVISVAAGIVLFIVYGGFGRTILRWNPVALLEHRRWQRFRKFLKDFSAIEQAPVKLLAIWDEYYVYAAALGVADEFLKHVARLAEQRGVPMTLPVWYVAASGMPGTGMASFADSMAGFSGFGQNMSSMMSSFSTASSSGGGFSGGGGSGGGGGSSGAG